MTAFEKFPKDGYAYSAADVGLALAGLIRRDAGVPKVGMLVAPSVAAVAASWKVQVGQFWYVSHINGAVQLSGLSAAEQVDITPATDIPAGQARIDRVVWNPVSETLVVVEGAAAVSPVAPPVGVNAAVCTVRVNAGDGMVVTARVSPDFATTSLAVPEPRPVDYAQVIHSLGAANSGGRSFATNLPVRQYARVLTLSNGDLASNGARFELNTTVLAAGASSASVAWSGGHAGLARLSFVAHPLG